MMHRLFFVFFVVISLAGCSSSPGSPYLVNPTPLKKGATKYHLTEVKVNLTLGHGAKDGDTQFVDEVTMNNQFSDAITEFLGQRGILVNSSDADADLSIMIDYHRTYNIGGNSLNLPRISHVVRVYNNQEELARLSLSNYSPSRSLGANIKIAAFNWKAEDELGDIQKIAALIANDIANLGR